MAQCMLQHDVHYSMTYGTYKRTFHPAIPLGVARSCLPQSWLLLSLSQE